jgi:ribonuclease HI
MKSASDIQSLSIWTDGSVLENSSSVGYEIRARGKTVSKGYDKLEDCDSSSHAEVHAVIFALKEANRYPNVCSVHLHTDYDTVEKMLEGEAKPSDIEMRSLFKEAKRLYESFEHQSVQYTDRQNNTTAHDLAHRGHSLSETEPPKLRRSIRLSD